jgi:DNA-binding GntR family transcriptional regulator
VVQAIVRPPSQSQLVYDQLRAALRDGTFGGGELLTESDLSRQLGVSTTPVHEAMVRLASEGFVELLPRRGVRVVRLTPRDIEEIMEVREALEAAVVRLAVERLTDADLEFLDDQLQTCREALASGHYPTFKVADVAIHTRIARASGNQRFVQLIRENRTWVQRIMTATVDYHILLPSRLPKSHEQHEELIAALHRRDPRAEDAVRRHISSLKEEILAYMLANGVNSI